MRRVIQEPPGGPWLHGVDISGWQDRPEIKFDALATAVPRVSFVIVKATEGVDYVSPDLDWQARGLFGLSTRPAVGFYHFARLDQSPELQARAFYREVSAVAAGRPILPCWLDLEWRGKGPTPHNQVKGKAAQTWIRAFCSTWATLTPHALGIYTGPNWWGGVVRQALAGVSGVAPLWLARHHSPARRPTKLPRGWDTWMFWQWTGEGTVAGIDDPIDRNLFEGTEAQLNALLARMNTQEEQRP